MLPLTVKSPPMIALPVVVIVDALTELAVLIAPVALTSPVRLILPASTLPVTLNDGSVPMLVATTPVSWLPLPR